jgi:hypothetical protein
MAANFARPFQLHLPGGRVLHGAQFPSGRVAVEDPDHNTCIAALALGVVLAAYGGVAIWPEDLARLGGES